MPLSPRLAARLRRYGPWAVVTGASSGIGAACANVLAEAGLSLVLVARRADALDALGTDLSARYGTRVRPVAADLGLDEGQTALETATASLDVGLFVAAAGFGTSGPFLGADLLAERDMMEVNAWAVLRGAHHFGRRFAAQRRGGLVLFGSLVGFQGTPYAAHYAATKAYVQTLGEALAVELKPQGVDVLVAAPGPVQSGFGARARMDLRGAATPEAVARGTLAALGRQSTVWPGLLSKGLIGSLAPLPRRLRTRIMARIMGGITAHQRR